MSETVYVNRTDVEPIINATFPGYRGTKIRVKAAESVTLTDLNWSGGGRSQYAGCDLAQGKGTGDASAGNAAHPWHNPYEGAVVPLQPGLALVQHTVFAGKDLGLTIHVHPSMLPKFLTTGGEELTPEQTVVLRCIRCLISSFRREEAARLGIDARAYERIVDDLKAKGLLSKQGGLTVEGKNLAAGLSGL